MCRMNWAYVQSRSILINQVHVSCFCLLPTSISCAFLPGIVPQHHFSCNTAWQARWRGFCAMFHGQNVDESVWYRFRLVVDISHFHLLCFTRRTTGESFPSDVESKSLLYYIYIINRLMSLQFFAHDLDFKDFQSLFITFCRCLAVSGVRPQEDIRPSLACRPLSTPWICLPAELWHVSSSLLPHAAPHTVHLRPVRSWISWNILIDHLIDHLKLSVRFTVRSCWNPRLWRDLESALSCLRVRPNSQGGWPLLEIFVWTIWTELEQFVCRCLSDF